MAEKQLERIAVKIKDIEQMILMSDKVLDEVMMGRISTYDENGVPLPNEKFEEQVEEDQRNGTDRLVWDLAREKHEIFDDVLMITASDLEKRLGHLRKRILGIFRSGVLEEWYRFYYFADPSVTDDWLFTMFLMRVRDRMIVFASQRMDDENKERRAEKECI